MEHNKENWLLLATSEIPENRELALQLAEGIKEEIQLELYIWAGQLSNPFHSVQLYELLLPDYQKIISYKKDEPIEPFKYLETCKAINSHNDSVLNAVVLAQRWSLVKDLTK